MHDELISRLRRHAEHWPEQRELAARFVAFVTAHPDCLLRTCVPGHITASAWILSADGERVLLTHHRKLGRWLQLGGHVDGEPRVELAALREAQEESGMVRFRFVPWSGGELVPLDLDVHTIPARRDEPAHLHWDVRFLLQAEPGQQVVCSPESNELRWFTADELAQVTEEDSVRRLGAKAASLRSR